MYLTEPAESETSSGNGVANHTYIGSSDHVILKDMNGHDDVKIVNVHKIKVTMQKRKKVTLKILSAGGCLFSINI